MNKKELIQAFLAVFQPTTIYALSEDKNTRRGTKTLELDEIEVENGNINKNGIYFTPNGGYTAGLQRKKENATIINASVIDIDNSNFDIDLLDIEPTYIVQTKRGYHIYFVYNKQIDYKKYEDRWTEHIIKLISIYDADTACKDISRLFRLPYTKYRKDNKGEFEIKLIKTDGPRYDFFELYEIVNNIYKPLKREEEDRKKYVNAGVGLADVIDDINKTFDVGEILYDITNGKYEVKGYNIYEDGKLTDGYKRHKQKNFVYSFSNHPERPIGQPFAVVKQVLGNTKDALKWFQDYKGYNTSDIIKRIDKQQYVYPKKEKIEKEGKIEYRDGKHILIFDYNLKKIFYNYEDSKNEQMIELVGAIIEPVGYIYSDDGVNKNIKNKNIVAKIITDKNEEFVEILPVLGGEGDLRKFLSKYSVFLQTNKTANGILIKYLYNTDKHLKYTKYIGLQEIDGKKYFITKGGSYMTDDGVFVNAKHLAGDYYELPQYDIDFEYNKTLDDLIKLYEGHIALPLFLMAVLLVYVYYFRLYGRQVPSIFLEGLAQSGKTTLKNFIIKQLLGIKYSISAGATVTSYHLIAVNFVPINVEDYRNNAIKDIDGLLDKIRNLYDGIATSRGNPSLELTFYPSNGQCIFDGQGKYADNATTSRGINLMATPKCKGDLKIMKKYKKNILGNILLLFNGREDFERFLEIVDQKRDDLFSIYTQKNYKEKDRVIQNYSYLFALLEWINCKQYEAYLFDALDLQLKREDTDDIMQTYIKAFNYFSLFGGNIEIVPGGFILDLNLDATRLNEKGKDDFRAFMKTINSYFGYDDINTEGIYIDFTFIENRKQIHEKFRQIIRKASIPSNGTREMYEIVGRLREFFEKYYPNDAFREELNYSINNFKS